MEPNELQSREKRSTDIQESAAPPLGMAAAHEVSAPQRLAIDTSAPALLSPVAGDQTPAYLASLADRARGYVEAASSANTGKAYASDWKHFSAWCRRSNLAPLPPDPQTVGLYITACASGETVGTPAHGSKANSVSTIERRLSSLSWNYAQRGLMLDRKDRHIATVMAGIRNSHARPPVQKEAVLAEDIIAMIETLDRGTLRGLRDRAMLLIGYAGGLRRSEIVGLDIKADQTEDGRGWIEIFDKGMLVTLRGKTGWREVEIGRGSSDATCPVVALESWITFARLAHGPLFRRVTGQGKSVGPERLNDKEVARLVKRTAMAAGVRGDLSEIERAFKFSGHSLRAGLASSAEVDERYIQKQLGHASAEMTRRYQRRRDRFRVNLTKAAGL
ncbi:tyrosine-type recombinase/integrase [Agrobacterium vitis]|uniref:Tyrosine-type recombinase/integrase n=2 Tax=Agrobacterium vitis TaxID=373 RepID=A0A6L6VDM3_AGRVI|nr:tyrosine-type recombinase/integrase [Agrobacterium vitis]